MKKVISLMLALVMVVTILPMNVFAYELKTSQIEEENKTEVKAEENDDLLDVDLPAEIVEEVISQRKENVKCFELSDGTYQLSTYNNPIHYKDNDGNWIDIDNTVKSKVVDGKKQFFVKNGDKSIKLPEKLSDESETVISNNGHELAFSFVESKAVSTENKLTIKDKKTLATNEIKSAIFEKSDLNEELLIDTEKASKALKVQNKEEIKDEKLEEFELKKEKIIESNEEKTTLDNLTSAVEYSNVFEDTDIEYIVTSNGIKENIVVNKAQDEYVYKFNFDFGDLDYRNNDNGSISFLDENEEVFTIKVPYAYDSNGEHDYSVTQSLEKKDGKWILTITADENWINDDERAFPVVIDPTIETANTDGGIINDTYVTNFSSYTGDNSDKYAMTVGYREDKNT